jgi:hypothetical protein
MLILYLAKSMKKMMIWQNIRLLYSAKSSFIKSHINPSGKEKIVKVELFT